jgi:hypothetical protein
VVALLRDSSDTPDSVVSKKGALVVGESNVRSSQPLASHRVGGEASASSDQAVGAARRVRTQYGTLGLRSRRNAGTQLGNRLDDEPRSRG